MATALAYPEPTNKGGRGKKNETTVLNTDVSSAYLKHARFVLRNCRDKALEVLRNSKYPLTVAYEEAQEIVEKQRLDEEVRQANLAALDELRIEYPDLAALVDDQRLGLPEAIAAGDQRREAAKRAGIIPPVIVTWTKKNPIIADRVFLFLRLRSARHKRRG